MATRRRSCAGAPAGARGRPVEGTFEPDAQDIDTATFDITLSAAVR